MRQIKAWFSDLFQFLWAVFNSWAGYATGGAIVALAWLWSTLFPRFPLSRKIAIGLALLFLFMAFFNAWRKQYHARAALEQERRRQSDRAGSILLISKFISDGQYLLFVNPHDNAGEKEIQEWRLKVQQWTQEASSYLWAIGRTKFDDLLDSQSEDFYGAHQSIWSELGILKTRLRNLKQIIEKPDIYLVGMG